MTNPRYRGGCNQTASMFWGNTNIVQRMWKSKKNNVAKLLTVLFLAQVFVQKKATLIDTKRLF